MTTRRRKKNRKENGVKPRQERKILRIQNFLEKNKKLY